MPKIKNIIIYIVIAICLILIYIFFIKKAPNQQNLISSASSSVSTMVTTTSQNTGTINENSQIAQNLLNVLLGVKNIKLDDSIFLNKAFLSLHDSSILLTPPADPGRPNPFAPIGYDAIPSPSSVITPDSSVIPPASTPPTKTPKTP